jgi:hypothetical protein
MVVSYGYEIDLEEDVSLLKTITNGFINFFGITQPTPKQQRQAEIFILSLLVLIVLVAALVFAVVVIAFGR